MTLTPKIINDPESFDAFRSLLKSSSLPADDLSFTNHLLIGYYHENDAVGTGGLEIYGDYALLRSLSVKVGIRGQAFGSFITDHLIDQANLKKLKAIYLLTETAHAFFLKKGFKDTPRDEVPEEVKLSSEFSKVCPTTAAVMKMELF